MSFRDERLWELKEAAKWSLSLEERRKAVAELANYYGGDALQTLLEIKDTTAYQEIKQACIEAIMSAKNRHIDIKVASESKKNQSRNSGRPRVKKKLLKSQRSKKEGRKRR